MIKGKGARRRAALFASRLALILVGSAITTALFAVGCTLVTMGSADIPAGIFLIILGVYLLGSLVKTLRGGSR